VPLLWVVLAAVGVIATCGTWAIAGTTALDDAARQLAAAFPFVHGVVVQVEGDRLVVDLGAKNGAYEGMELEVYREAEAIRHPLSGEALGHREVTLAVIRLVDIQWEFSEGIVVRRETIAVPRWGDRVRVPVDRIVVALPRIDPGTVTGLDVAVLTKELAIALMKSNRFMVLEEPVIRASLASGGRPRVRSFADPATLSALAEQLKAQAVIIGALGASEARVFLHLQVLSTASGATIALASVALSPR